MNGSKIITYFSCIAALTAAFFVYLNFHPENLMKKDNTPVTQNDIEADRLGSFTGHAAGDDIPRISGKDEFEDMLNIDYVTVEPVDIIATGVSSLKPWESPYVKSSGTRGTGSGTRKKEVVKSFWDLTDTYNEYYLIKCPDGTYILAQMPDSYVKAIKNGKNVTLPIGQKAALTNTAKSYLKEICDEYDASLNGALYVFDTEWYEEHSFTIFIIKTGAAVVVFFLLAVLLMTILEKTSGKEKDKSLPEKTMDTASLFEKYLGEGNDAEIKKLISRYCSTDRTYVGTETEYITALNDISYLFRKEYAEIFRIMINGEYENMYQACNEAISLEPENGDLYVIRAYAYARRKSAVSPIIQLNKDYTEALKYNPNDVMVLRARCGLSSTKKKCREQNIGDVTKLIELDNENREEYLLHRAYFCKWAEWQEQAVQDLEEVISMNGRFRSEAEDLLAKIKNI